MSETFTITIDGELVEARAGQTLLEAADGAGIYIPRLCHKDGLSPFGSCRLCTVKVSGRPGAACTQPVTPGMVVENQTEELIETRKALVEMLFVEGNHFCMFCEKSGNCELQALAYRFGIAAPRFEYDWPARSVDASHEDAMIDRNRCILCARCVRSSRELDDKVVFGFAGRGKGKHLIVNARGNLADTTLEADDQSLRACPVGALIPKGIGFAVPVGKRIYDHEPIGTGIESKAERG